jgi:hypothetical protein
MSSHVSVNERAGSPELILTGIALLALVLAIIYFVYQTLQPVLAVAKQATSVTGSIASFFDTILALLSKPFAWILGKLNGTPTGNVTLPLCSQVPIGSTSGSCIPDPVPSSGPNGPAQLGRMMFTPTVTPALSLVADANNIGAAPLDNNNNPVCANGYTPMMDSTGVWVCVPNSAQAPFQSKTDQADNVLVV